VKGNSKQLKKKKQIIEYFKDVPVYKYAAMHVGIDEDTLILWRKADSDFSDKLDRERTEWVRGRVKKAKVEFALERLEKEVFSQKIEQEFKTSDPVMVLLQKYGITEGEGEKRKTMQPKEDV
jgi:hypothetical protein